MSLYFDRKKSKNAAYSLRALARDIGRSPAYVSQIFSGKRRLTPDLFEKLTNALEMDELARREFSLSLVFDSELAPEMKSDLRSSIESKDHLGQEEYGRYQESDLSDFDILTNWYSIAILDLVSLKNFRPQTPWIAKRLKLSVPQVEYAVQNLFAKGFLVEEDGAWRKSKYKLRFSTKTSKESVRNYHRQMIEKSLQELLLKTAKEDFEKRLITGITIASNPRSLEKAKMRLNEMLFEIAAIFSEGPCTELYQLNAQLFSLTTTANDDEGENK